MRGKDWKELLPSHTPFKKKDDHSNKLSRGRALKPDYRLLWKVWGCQAAGFNSTPAVLVEDGSMEKGRQCPCLKQKEHGIADQSVQFQSLGRTEEICLEVLKNGEGLGGEKNRAVSPTCGSIQLAHDNPTCYYKVNKNQR